MSASESMRPAMKLDDDDFTLFGLPQRFALERAEVDQRWRSLQAQVHPDRFSAEGAASQRLAMQWAVRVNQAHQRLKDPLARAAYLCELRGAPINAERNTAMPTSFLAQRSACAMTKGELSRVSDCAGTFVASRRPRVVNGFGASNTWRNGFRFVRRTRR